MKAIYLTITTAALLSFFSPGKVDASEAYYAAPKVFKVKTVEMERCEVEETSINEEGESVRQRVSIVIFKDVFSDGTKKLWRVTEPVGKPFKDHLREAKSYVAAPRG